jgi:recombination protein RecT
MEKSMTSLAVITSDIYASRDGFQSVLAEPSLSFDREAGFAVQVLESNDFALKTAMGNRQSVVNAITNIAAIGISLNPAKKQAYLVPRDGKICLDISYIGLMDLAVASGSILWGQARVVRKNDAFILNDLDKLPTHSYAPFSKDRGEIVGVYVVVKTPSGDYLTHPMSLDEVYEIRDRSSQSWKGGKASPWKTDPGEMIKKTCVKQASKYWPKTDRLSEAIHHLNTDGGEGLTNLASASPRDGADWVDVESLIVAAQKTTTDAEALAFWSANNGSLKAQPQCHKRFKSAVGAHRAKMQAAEAARTIDMPATTAKPTPVPDALAGLIADMEAAADGGTEAFEAAWGSLSKATKGSLAAHYEALSARAAKAAE